MAVQTRVFPAKITRLSTPNKRDSTIKPALVAGGTGVVLLFPLFCGMLGQNNPAYKVNQEQKFDLREVESFRTYSKITRI